MTAPRADHIVAGKVLNLTDEEQAVIQKALGVAIYNANHADPKPFTPEGGDEYNIVCSAFNKICGVSE